MRFVVALALGLAASGLVAAGGTAGKEAKKGDNVKKDEKDKKLEEIEKVMIELITQISATADVLETVTDKASASAALPKLRVLGAKLQKLQDDGDKLGKPDPKLKGELEAKYKGKISSAAKRVIGATVRIGGIDGGPEFLKELESIFPRGKSSSKKTSK